MYFPKSQITTNLYTNGKEYVYAGTNKEYIGYYFQTSNGKYYTGKNPNDPPVEEIVIPQTSVVNDAEEGEIGNYSQEAALYLVPDAYAMASNIGINAVPPKPPTQTINLPTEENYDLGEYQRYFTSKDNEIRYTEIDKKQYEKFVNQEPDVDYSLYTAFKLPWLITGNRNEVVNVNKRTIERVSSNLTLSGFDSYFRGKYSQYFKYFTNENLYTDGSEFVNSLTRKPYKGYYHRHPEKGPMVGAQHIDKPHDFLIPISEMYSTLQTGSYRIPTGSLGISYFRGGSPPPIAPRVNPAFVTTWNVPSNNFDIVIGLDSTKTYNFTVDWGDGQQQTITSNTDLTHTYATSGNYFVTINGTFPRIVNSQAAATHNNLIAINNWGNIKWESMNSAFDDCINLENNQIKDTPDLSNVTDMRFMFDNAGSNASYFLIKNIDKWDTSNVTLMNSMFRSSSYSPASPDIKNWDVSKVTNMANMFKDTPLFNSPLDNWNTSALQFMGSMFESASAFNQSVDHFNTSGVTSMNFIFAGANAFNQPLNSWDVSNVTSMQGVFANAYDFNQPLNNWNVGNVTDMGAMFFIESGFTGKFDQDISSWNILKVFDFTQFLTRQQLSTPNYDRLLIGWRNTLNTTYPAGAGYPYKPTASFGTSRYTATTGVGTAATARAELISNFGWTITDGGSV